MKSGRLDPRVVSARTIRKDEVYLDAATRKFEPVILAFLCNWCSYSAADQAGCSRRSYPANVRIVRIMCTGRLDPGHVIEAFARGIDGVLVCGCHPGDCHYVDGNCKAAGRVWLLDRMLEQTGIEPGRLRIEWVSSTEAQRFAELAIEMTEQVRAMGPIRWPFSESAGTEARRGSR